MNQHQLDEKRDWIKGRFIVGRRIAGLKVSASR